MKPAFEAVVVIEPERLEHVARGQERAHQQRRPASRRPTARQPARGTAAPRAPPRRRSGSRGTPSSAARSIASWTMTNVRPHTAATPTSASSATRSRRHPRSRSRSPPARSARGRTGTATAAGTRGSAGRAPCRSAGRDGSARRAARTRPRARAGAASRRAPPRATRRAGTARAACRRGARACRPARRAGRTRTAARRPRSCAPRPAARTGSRGLLERRRLEPREVVAAERAQDRPGCAPPWCGRGRPGGSPPRPRRRGASRTVVPRVEALAQPLVGHVAVAVVRVLGQHREHELVDRRAVGARQRPAVRRAQPVADAAHAAAVRALPLGGGHAGGR